MVFLSTVDHLLTLAFMVAEGLCNALVMELPYTSPKNLMVREMSDAMSTV